MNSTTIPSLLNQMGREVLRRFSSFQPSSSTSQQPKRERKRESHTSFFTPSLLSRNYVDEKGVFQKVASESSQPINHVNLNAMKWAFLVKQWMVFHLTKHWSCDKIPRIRLEECNCTADVNENVLDLFQELSSKRSMTSEHFQFVRVFELESNAYLCSTWVENTLYDLWQKQ